MFLEGWEVNLGSAVVDIFLVSQQIADCGSS